MILEVETKEKYSVEPKFIHLRELKSIGWLCCWMIFLCLDTRILDLKKNETCWI